MFQREILFSLMMEGTTYLKKKKKQQKKRMKGLPVVPDCVLEDPVSPCFQSPAFKLHGLKLLDVIIKDLTSLKKLLFLFLE